jgi:hypothetical protein
MTYLLERGHVIRAAANGSVSTQAVSIASETRLDSARQCGAKAYTFGARAYACRAMAYACGARAYACVASAYSVRMRCQGIHTHAVSGHTHAVPNRAHANVSKVDRAKVNTGRPCANTQTYAAISNSEHFVMISHPLAHPRQSLEAALYLENKVNSPHKNQEGDNLPEHRHGYPCDSTRRGQP